MLPTITESSPPPPDQLLRQALASPPPGISPTKLRQLRILAALVDGKTGAFIAGAEGVTPSAVSKLNVEMDRDGVAAVMARLLRPPADRKQGTRNRAGRPGYEDFDQWAAAQSAEDEPVFELATLMISRDVQIASIAIREGRESEFVAAQKAATDKPDRKARFDARFLTRLSRLRREFRQIATIPIFWTRASMLDTRLADVFHWLKEGFSRIQDRRSDTASAPNMTPLKDRFGPRYFHIILTSGPARLCNAAYDRLSAGEQSVLHMRVDANVGFLRHLEAVLHHRRLTKSCLGLLPGISPFYDAVKLFAHENSSIPFIYESTESIVSEFVAVQRLTQEYFAARGILVTMNSFLWPKIAYREDIQFQTLSKHPEIEVDHEIVDGHIRVVVNPLPGIAYERFVPWSGTPKDFEKHARKLYREDAATKEFVYSTARPSDQGTTRTSLAVSGDFLITKGAKRKPKPVGVALFPRHFLLPAPELPLEELTALATSGGDATCFTREVGTDSNESLEVLHVPYLVDALRQSVGNGKLWYRLVGVEKWQDLLAEIGQDAKGSSGKPYDEIFWRLRPKAVLEKDEWDLFMDSLSPNATPADIVEMLTRHFSENPAPPQTAETRKVSVKNAIFQILNEALKNPEIIVGLLNSQPKGWLEQQRESMSAFEPFLASGEASLPGVPSEEGADEQRANTARRSELQSAPNERKIEERMNRRPSGAQDLEQDFENSLKQLDADFLLRNLDSPTRIRLEADAAEWAKQCAKVVSAEYWSGNRVNRDRIKQLIKPQLWSFLKGDRADDDYESICGKLLTNFCNDQRITIRRVMETMQRCALHGLPPIAIATASKSSILIRWRALVRDTINKWIIGLKLEDDAKIQFFRDSVIREPDHSDSILIEEIRGVVASILGGDYSKSLLLGFRELAQDESQDTWDAALIDFGDPQDPTGWFQNILTALELCQRQGKKETAGQQSEAFLAELRRTLEKG